MLRAAMLAFACLTLISCEQNNVMKQIEAQQAAREKAATENAEKSRAFLADNAMKPGIKTTPSGLQYQVVRAVAANVAKPTPTDKVTVNYEGKLIDGKVFDSSYARHEPIDIVLNKVIPGWTEGLQRMKPGEEFLFFIPPDIGYGLRGAGGDIPPNAALVFKVELLKFARPDGTVVAAK